jgi:Xaa-Pro aminopeptidase
MALMKVSSPHISQLDSILVCYVDTLGEFLKREFLSESDSAKLHLMSGKNSDSGLFCTPARFDGDEEFQSRVETGYLFHAVSTARVTKSVNEIEAMRYSAYVASNAHVEVMRTVTAGQS